ncbi:alpha/beta fold hydrolase [Streptomyces johnsoniae]|uniref:Alpha/beta hydrolase n=1 Tax=Streptomyces johnsoniae TaxID=3075532 RepID=A0ABU2SC07_9ACTN|nr:alpha/beta hydrolase [Streptomyces sp. DSM 41886]MDT0446513.1 alpha/beta hydrolase [Streptomyces sp. DSM 41886]
MINRRAVLLASLAAAGAMTTGAGRGSATGVRRPVRTGYLRVPGARLYYEIRGCGHPLLMIHGGQLDAGSFAAIAPVLADQYTVITYDRRGNSRSRLHGPATDLRVDQQADDALRLLAELTDGTPHVFGSSGGGVVALELAARHGHRLGHVVSHEPPFITLLQDAAALRARYDAVHHTYRTVGAPEAYEQFAALDPGEKDPATDLPYPGGDADPDFGDRIEGNLEFMLAHEMLPFIGYRPHLDGLRAKLPELVLGVGHYRAEIATRIVVDAADRLGTEAVEFPGDHVGYMWRPDEFAEGLHATLA